MNDPVAASTAAPDSAAGQPQTSMLALMFANNASPYLVIARIEGKWPVTCGE